MTPREEILQQALALPPQDRAFVAAALEESLSAAGDEDSSSELLAELQRRSMASALARRALGRLPTCSPISGNVKPASTSVRSMEYASE